MKVLFLQRDPLAQMGIMIISAMVRKSGHQVFLLIENLEKNLDKEIQRIDPDIIAFSVTTGLHNWACHTAKRIKGFSTAQVIVGGAHATFFPEVIEKEGIDIICRGEGEYAIVELLEKLQKNESFENIKNLWVKKDSEIIQNSLSPLVRDLDSLPFLDRSIYDKYRYLKLYYEHDMVSIASRGCPFNCSYCFNESFRKLYPHQLHIRRRSVDNVVSELKEVKKKYRVKRVHFYDDIFIMNQDWITDFCEKYQREIKLPFTCLGHFDFIKREVIQDLKKAGCITLKIGLEAGDEAVRENILNKRISNEKVFEACRVIKEEKLNMSFYNMMGYPNSNLEKELETIKMNIKIRPRFTTFFLTLPLPKTAMTENAIKNGYLDKNFNFDNVSESTSSSIHYELHDKRLIVNLHRLSILSVYFPFLLPLVKLLIKAPPNIIYYGLFQVFYAYTIWRIHRFNFFDLVRVGLKTQAFLQTKTHNK
jgi:radical SAM superfamily enzyme YgiQ (UPF0313 family)